MLYHRGVMLHSPACNIRSWTGGAHFVIPCRRTALGRRDKPSENDASGPHCDHKTVSTLVDS